MLYILNKPLHADNDIVVTIEAKSTYIRVIIPDFPFSVIWLCCYTQPGSLQIYQICLICCLCSSIITYTAKKKSSPSTNIRHWWLNTVLAYIVWNLTWHFRSQARECSMFFYPVFIVSFFLNKCRIRYIYIYIYIYSC